MDCVWEAQATLGEGPIWIEQEQALYWVDIFESHLHRYCPSSEKKETWKHEPFISAIIPTDIPAENGEQTFIATYKDGVKLIRGNHTQTLFDPEPNLKENRLNDAYADHYGNLWIGSMHHSIETQTGKFYCIRPDLTYTALSGDYWVTNGPAFDPINNWIYLVSSQEKTILRGKLHEDGHIENLAPWVITKGPGTPDGIAVDADQCLWVTHFGGARITRYRPNGAIEREISVPALNTTKCAFGGKDLSTLYITTANVGMTAGQRQEYPLSGGLFATHINGIQGIPTASFAIKTAP